MNLNTYNRILKLRNNYRISKPHVKESDMTVYIGHDEFYEILKDATCVLGDCKQINNDTFTLFGMKVVRVLEDSYLAIGETLKEESGDGE